MSFDSLKNILNLSETAQNKISNLKQEIDNLLGLQEEKQNIVEDAAHQTVVLKSQVEQRERTPEEEKMLDQVAYYVEKAFTTQDRQSFHNLFSGKDLKEDIANFLEEQLVIETQAKKGDVLRQIALQKAYEVYDSDGYIQKLLHPIADFYVKQDQKERYASTLDFVKKMDVPDEKTEVHQRSQRQQETTQHDNERINHHELLTQDIIATAKQEVGITEFDRVSDKYFRTLGYKYSTRKTPWCGAFVSWVLLKNGIQPPKNALSSKAFIGKDGEPGHVGIKVEGKVISGNYGNKVARSAINKPIQGFALVTPKGLVSYQAKAKFEDIPEGAIVVYDRKNSDRDTA